MWNAEDITSGPLNSSHGRFTFVDNTTCNSPNVARTKFLEGDKLVLLVYVGRFKTGYLPF